MTQREEATFDEIVSTMTDAATEMQAFVRFDVERWSDGADFRRGMETVCGALRRLRRRGPILLATEDVTNVLAADQFGRTWVPWIEAGEDERRTCDACGIRENDGWELEDEEEEDEEDGTRCQWCVEFVNRDEQSLVERLVAAVSDFDGLILATTTAGDLERYERAIEQFRSVLRRLRRMPDVHLTPLTDGTAVDGQGHMWARWRTRQEHTRKLCEACGVTNRSGWKTRGRVRCNWCAKVAIPANQREH